MSIITHIIALITAVFLISCEHKSHNETRELVPDPEANKKDTFIITDPGTTTKDRWNFNKYLHDPGTPQLAKDIFNNHWKLKDDEPLQFLGNLHGEDKEARPFYFRVVTNSYKQADGAYAEGLGAAAYAYVKKYPGEFSNYFIGQEAFSDDDLQAWADMVMLEFEIVSEDEYEKPLLKNYLDTVEKNCNGCSTQQKKVIETFGRYLSKRWTAFLKHIDK